MPRQRTFVLLVTIALAIAPASASADTLFPMARERTVDHSFGIAGCGATATRTISAPARSSRVHAVNPDVGDDVYDEPGDAVVGQVTAVQARGRRVTFTVTGAGAACAPPGPNCATSGEDCPFSGTTEAVELTIRYTRRERVYVTGSGRGGRRAYKPSTLPFGQRSSIVGLRWSGWGSATAVGHGRVEFNNCVPSCAEARASYYPVRATLTRRRECNGYAQYLTLRFRYTTAARPEGLPSTYREQFGSACG